MDKLGPTLIIVAVTLLVFVGMWQGWRRRTRRDAGLRAEHTIPAAPGTLRTEFEAFYVASTEHGRPLERVTLSGLAFRARAHVAVHDAGVTLSMPGESPVFIPADAMESAGRATATIDRVVEPGGLIRLTWRVSATPASGAPSPAHTIDSYLRPIEPGAAASFLAAVSAIAPSAEINPTERKRGAA